MFRRRQRRLRWLIEFLLAWPWLQLLRFLPERWMAFASRWLGWGAYWLSASDRRWCDFNLRLVYGPHLTDRQRRRLSLAVYEHHARTIIEILRMDEAWIARRCSAQGVENLLHWQRANPQRGFLIVGGHIGNFEVLVGFGNTLGVQSAMISRPLENPYFERWLQERRRCYGLVSVSRKSSMPREVLRRLRQGQGVGLAIDQNAARGGVFVDFLGVPAATARGAAVLALRENAAVFVISSYRREDGSHRIVLGPPIEPLSTGDFERDVVANMQLFTREFERRILQHPEQYHWQHARWRTRPDGSLWRATDSVEPFTSRKEPYLLPPARFRRNDRRENPRTALERMP